MTLLSRADFVEFVAAQLVAHKERLANKPKSLMPILTIKSVDAEGEDRLTVVGIAMNFNEDHEKRETLMALGAKFLEDKQLPLAVALSCEAWLAQNPPPGVQPRHFEGRREVMLLAVKGVGDNLTKMVSIPVRRDHQDRMEAMEGAGYDGEPKTIAFPILDHFFKGYALAVAAKYGLNPVPNPVPGTNPTL